MRANDQNLVSTVHTYRVRVGHTQVTVSGESRDEAIRRARSQLCRDMPRMWDVIQKLEEQRFEVDEV